VAFSPADVALVAGGPSERRRYLDVLLALSSPAYLTALQQYRAALSQRNAALKLAQREGGRGQHGARVSVWEPALAEHGGVILAARQAFVQQQGERYAALCQAIGDRDAAELRYRVMGSYGQEVDRLDPLAQRDALANAFAQQRPNELRRGTTAVGPHRDDLQLLLGGHELRTFGSAGQQRSAAIALRLMELATLRDALGVTPLLLLDDPFAELDLPRAARVLGLLDAAGVGQLLLAVPRTDDIPAAFSGLERATMRDGQLIGP
jgi:DNA replication and repair protein RecF